VGSLFHRQGAAYRKERLVIFKEERVGGRARVTIDEAHTTASSIGLSLYNGGLGNSAEDKTKE